MTHGKSDERGEAASLDPAAKRALLATLLRAGTRPAGPVPLSFAQRRLWLLDRIEPDASTYNVTIATRLVGTLDLAALELALAEIVSRHDVLRSVVTLCDGEPAHTVDPSFRLPLPLVDLADGGREALEAVLAAERTRPFDLYAAPAIRASLVRLGAREHVLCVVIHHIATDGWSTSIFNGELSAFYNAYANGTAASLPALRATYADYVRAERERLGGERLERGLHYWKERLHGAPPALDLFPLRPSPAARTSSGRATSRTLDAESAAAVRRLSRERGVTLFSTLLAALVALLHRYCGSRDIVVGSASANRTRAEYEDVVGFFVNTLALRTQIDGDPAFAELLAHVQAAALEAFDHQEIPFDKLVEELHPERAGSRTPFVNVMFVLQNTPEAALTLDGIAASAVALERTTAKFDLTLQATVTPAGLDLSLEYTTDLFESATAAALLEAYETLLAGAAANFRQTLSQLPLLAPAALHRQIVEWNATARPLTGRRMEELFERQAARWPQRTALVAGHERLSYRELDERANRLARYLQSCGVRPGSRVGLCLERGAATVTGILAILKAGAAYVPIDPDYPRERLAFMLADAGAGVVLSRRRLFVRLRAASPDVACVDVDAPAVRAFAADAVGGRGTGDDLAYVMYTSGSTGTPKGVMIAHRGIERLAADPTYVSISPDDVVAQTSTFSFDASTFEVWGALSNGARLVIVPKDVVLSARSLAECIGANGISVMFLTTSLFNELAREAPDTFGRLAYLVVGGEALGVPAVARVLANGPPRHIVNGYGPTEATTFAAFHTVEGDALAPRAAIPIGRPLTNTVLRVLDERRNLLPAGACGELYVGGPGLALGYLHDPASTRAKFVRDPFAHDEGAMLYATGDRARYLPGGELEFLGRLDGQLKLRGFRIEPGEIEAALRTCAGVHAAVATVRNDAAGNAKLVAYVTARGNTALDQSDVTRTLRKRLPRYLIPDAIVPLRALPLTPSGKVDRAALPAPDARSGAAVAAAQPSSELHVQLVALWQRLLGASDVGITDDFFSLGGHSLLAARLVAEIDALFGTRLPLSVLFERPTIERLAQALQAAPESFNRAPLVRLNADGASTPLTFLHGSLTGGGYYCLELARRLGEERPLHVIRPHGVDGGVLPATLETMAAEYVEHVKTAQPCGPYALGGYCSGGLVALEMARLLSARGDAVSNVVLLDAREPIPRLRALIEGIERLRLPAGVSGAARTLAARLAARLRLHARRFIASSSKRRFLYERALRLRTRVVAPARPAAGQVERDEPRSLLQAWQRVTDAYVPRRYDGRLTVLTSTEAAERGAKPERWLSLAPRAELHTIPGGHFTCVTDYIEQTAAHVSRAISPPLER